MEKPSAEQEVEYAFGDEEESVADVKPKRSGFLGFLIDNWFMLSTILGVIIGFVVGFFVQRANLSAIALTWLGMPGDIYIRLLKLTILPMISANIITVMANLNPKENGKVSAISLGFMLVFNVLSPLIGVMYAYIIQPGKYARESADTDKDPTTGSGNQISYIFKDLLLNIFPDNIVGVTLYQASTNYSDEIKGDNGEITYREITATGTNMIGVLFCSVVFGIAANAAKEKGQPFKNFFTSLGDVVMLLMQKFLLITPVGVMFMVISSIAGVEDLGKTFISLGFFVLLNVVGQITHLICLILSLIVLGKNPFRILKYCLPSYFIAFATTSAVVCLPKAFVACDQYGIPKPISRFVLPFAGTMKSDASAVFIASACIFVAQAENEDLNIAKVVIIVILAFAYVTALPNIPSASVVAVITILGSIGVDENGAALLYAVEFINDRLRSGNVALSHLYCTCFTYHAVEKDFEKDGIEDGGKGEISDVDW
ncbi:hypothetical protein Aperf_G00000125797 [Anoplocephala perfoliata]